MCVYIKNSIKEIQICKEQDRRFFGYVVPPLEGFWWQDNVEGVDYSNKSAFNWIPVIRLPDFIQCVVKPLASAMGI